ncbi:MAG TPA: quinone-dependent dihydroorotate dehydrogenase [Candidatus Limnocylindria bacterium]|nr:quinone-dependent dihydroorotate dehydrogenase [Candidatus Limnocylindria bacterium]
MGWPSLSTAVYRLARPLLFRVDSERIHRLTLGALRRFGDSAPGRGALSLVAGRPRRGAPISVAGLHVRNRIGLGAGFDKDGVALRGWAALGLGFVELGTVTPIAQPGNAAPRLFRLRADRALINRMGFNNDGAEALAARIAAARPALPEGFVVGVNIGRNRETPDERVVDDYLACYRAVAPVADYVALNVSSPNTPGLRAMQTPSTIRALLEALVGSDQRGAAPPLLVKLAPDLTADELLALGTAVVDAGGAGIVVANTTVSRAGLRTPAPLRDEGGGLSGQPLQPRTLELVATVRGSLGDRLAIVASGGIGSGSDAAAAIDAGADLVELWTGLVYAGPGLIGEAVAATT